MMSGGSIERLADDGAMARQEQLCRARNLCARQLAIVRLLERAGRPTAAARTVLSAFERALARLDPAWAEARRRRGAPVAPR